MGQKESHLSIIVLGFIFHYLVSWVVRFIIIETRLMSYLHYCIGFYFPLLSYLGS
jgi:hypothetical protein